VKPLARVGHFARPLKQLAVQLPSDRPLPTEPQVGFLLLEGGEIEQAEKEGPQVLDCVAIQPHVGREVGLVPRRAIVDAHLDASVVLLAR